MRSIGRCFVDVLLLAPCTRPDGEGGGGGLLGHSVVLWADVESSSSEPPGARTVIERMLWVLIAFLPAFAPDIMHDESVLLGTAGVD